MSLVTRRRLAKQVLFLAMFLAALDSTEVSLLSCLFLSGNILLFCFLVNFSSFTPFPKDSISLLSLTTKGTSYKYISRRYHSWSRLVVAADGEAMRLRCHSSRRRRVRAYEFVNMFRRFRLFFEFILDRLVELFPRCGVATCVYIVLRIHY